MKQEEILCAMAVVPDKFRLGRVTASHDASEVIGLTELLNALTRHGCGDWLADERERNERAIRDGTPVISYFETESRVRYRLITNSERSSTTIEILYAPTYRRRVYGR